MQARHQTKEGLDALLAPRFVAVVGASPDPASVGHALMKSILDGGYRSIVYPVHPRAPEVLGRKAFTSVAAIPGPVDLAVIAVPAAAVLEVAEACGRKGVRGLVVVSAGFKEVDAAGARREEELRAILARHGMRMVGPNCLGIINNSPSVRLQATFAPRPLLDGSAALVSQSGAVGIALLEHAAQAGLGIARFVSMGNKADVSGNDLLLLWEDDPEVRQVLMYLENVGNPRNFVRIARRLSRRKPIVVVKSGRSEAGARAAGSHTGALLQSDAIVDALFQQCGVIRAQTTEELFDLGTAFASQPGMAGPRVAVVTNSGGPAIVALDAMAKAGLVAAAFSPATLARVAEHLPAQSHAANPLDLLAGGTPQAFESCLRAVLDDPGVDGVLAIWTPLQHGMAGQADAIARAVQGASKPVVAVTFGHGPGAPAFEALKAARVPVYTFPENAVRSLAALRAFAANRAAAEPGPGPRVERARAEAVLARARILEGGWLAMADALALLDAYGIAVPRHREVRSPEEAAAAARELGLCVLKLEAPGLVHKTEAGAVRLGLATPEQAAQAYRDAHAAVAARGLSPSSALVMASAAAAPEVLVGATQEPLFGPVVACGAGGIYAEILQDVQLRLAPLSAGEAAAMVGQLRIARVLAGARGQPPADTAALADVVARLAALAADFPAILEVEANPVRVLPRGQGAVALDARVRLAAASAGAPATRLAGPG